MAGQSGPAAPIFNRSVVEAPAFHCPPGHFDCFNNQISDNQIRTAYVSGPGRGLDNASTAVRRMYDVPYSWSIARVPCCMQGMGVSGSWLSDATRIWDLPEVGAHL